MKPVIALPVQRLNPDTDQMGTVLLTVNVNQQIGKIITGFDRY